MASSNAKFTLLLLLLVVVVVVVVVVVFTNVIQHIYNYIPETMFLDYIMLLLVCVCHK